MFVSVLIDAVTQKNLTRYDVHNTVSGLTRNTHIMASESVSSLTAAILSEREKQVDLQTKLEDAKKRHVEFTNCETNGFAIVS